MERKSLRELVAQKQVFAPIVWDVMSAKCAEIAGFEATLLSGGVVAGNCATPDIGLITIPVIHIRKHCFLLYRLRITMQSKSDSVFCWRARFPVLSMRSEAVPSIHVAGMLRKRVKTQCHH